MATKTHHLKIWPKFFKAVQTNKKLFELRTNDRDFREGDLLVLQEWHPIKQQYTGREVERKIGYILEGMGTEPGVAVLGFDLKHLLAQEEKPMGKTLEDRKKDFGLLLEPYLSKYGRKMLKEFFNYWTEHGPRDRKMRFEKQTSFDVGRRLGTWARNNKDEVVTPVKLGTFKK